MYYKQCKVGQKVVLEGGHGENIFGYPKEKWASIIKRENPFTIDQIFPFEEGVEAGKSHYDNNTVLLKGSCEGTYVHAHHWRLTLLEELPKTKKHTTTSWKKKLPVKRLRNSEEKWKKVEEALLKAITASGMHCDYCDYFNNGLSSMRGYMDDEPCPLIESCGWCQTGEAEYNKTLKGMEKALGLAEAIKDRIIDHIKEVE